MKGTRAQTAGRHLGDEEILRLLAACAADPSPIGIRDAALISVAYATGARIHEIKDLTLEDITYTQENAAALLLHGKGDKERNAYLYNGAMNALNRWIDKRGATDGHVFNPVQKGGKLLASLPISIECC